MKWWLSYREAETIIIVLTAGSLLWNGNSFSESGTTALPSVARTAFRAVPLWLDLTAIAADTTASGWRRDGRFIDAVASISSRLRGIPKDDLFGEDLKRHRQSITTATVLLVTAIGAATVAAWQWRVAVQRADETEAALIWSRLDFEQSEDPRTNASVQSLWDLARASEGVRGAFLRHLAENRSHVGKLVAAPTLIMRAFGVHPHEQEIQRLLGPIFDAVRESYDSSQLQALAQAVHTLGAGLRRTQAGVGPVLDAIQRTPSPYQREALVKGLLTLIPDLPPELDFGHSGWEASSLSKAFQ